MGKGDEEEVGRKEVKNKQPKPKQTTDKTQLLKHMKINIIQKITVTVFSLLFAIGASAQINSNAPLALPMFASAQAMHEYAIEQVREGFVGVGGNSAIHTAGSRSGDSRTFTNDWNPRAGIDW